MHEPVLQPRHRACFLCSGWFGRNHAIVSNTWPLVYLCLYLYVYTLSHVTLLILRLDPQTISPMLCWPDYLFWPVEWLQTWYKQKLEIDWTVELMLLYFFQCHKKNKHKEPTGLRSECNLEPEAKPGQPRLS